MLWNKKQAPTYVVASCALSCTREKCPKWVVLNHEIRSDDGTVKNVPEGRCADAWMPVLLVEQTAAINRLARQGA